MISITTNQVDLNAKKFFSTSDTKLKVLGLNPVNGIFYVHQQKKLRVHHRCTLLCLPYVSWEVAPARPIF